MSETFSRTEKATQIIWKNSLAISIVLGGLFLGSLFVDIGQLVLGRGFSQSAVREHEVLEQGERTWVAYRDPRVDVTLLTDPDCKACDTDEALVWLRRVLPTMSISIVFEDSDEGRQLIQQHEVQALPTFIFSSTLSKTDFFTQANSLFRSSGKQYLLNIEELGLPIGKYLRTPSVNKESVVLGNREAPLTVVIYSDFQCNFCSSFHTNQIKKLLDEYGNQAAFVFKALPLDTHPKASLLAAASLCANEQGKYFEYASAIFGKQRELEQRQNTKQELKNLSWMAKLNWKTFSDCLDQDRFAEQVTNEAAEARSLGLTATPAVFIGNRFLSGAAEYDTLRQMMNDALGESH
ncbi:MAG: thioredoxin domain-containing protein [Candidatus Moranbacteria bacterium]|jgi:protein-disulfide isomerase|nr:thioredoxin domain-containing protein [Candidatus Moranbacteria bacterium]MBP9801923.1 thioredoxin domain-containing protein [Candidatus Moranbacteria bacterium]